MSESVEQLLLSLLKRQSDQATTERRELRESFERNLTGIRNELRVFGVIVLLGLLALLGVSADVQLPGMSVQTTTAAAESPTLTITTSDPERAADAVTAEDPRSDADHAPLEP